MHLTCEMKREKKLKKLQTFDLDYFNGKSYFDDDESQFDILTSFRIFEK